MSVCICLFNCLSVLSPKPHGRISPNFLCILPLAVVRSLSDGVAILPVLWMTSCSQAVGCMVRHMYRARQLYKNISMLFMFPVKDVS